MQIEIRRLQANRHYTESAIYVNDKKHVPYAVEHTFTMLPIGEYMIKLLKGKSRRREIVILPMEKVSVLDSSSIPPKPYTIIPSHSWVSAKSNNAIVIGEQLIPGAVQKGRDHYDRLFDRIEKCKDRGEAITLHITDDCCEESEPIKYWLSDSMHGCLPSKRRVEVDSKGNATIYDGNKKVKYLSIEEQIANRLNNDSINYKP